MLHDNYRRAGIAASAVLALTAVHHAIGAVLYRAPWRLHVAIVAPVIAFVILWTLRRASAGWGTRSGAFWTRLSTALILIFPVGFIGLAEGAYNHVVKNLIFFTLGARMTRAIFPPPLYELPGNFLFEATGILQFPLALVAGYLALALVLARTIRNFP